jgi:predicted secreted hydrolase
MHNNDIYISQIIVTKIKKKHYYKEHNSGT